MEHFVVCSRGCKHWGAHGAAGVLLRGPQDRYLLVQRGLRTHQGGTWSVPGGAALQGEDPFDAALREADEEMGTLPVVTPVREHRDDHGGWAYVTVVAEVSAEFEPSDLSWETGIFGGSPPGGHRPRAAPRAAGRLAAVALGGTDSEVA